MLQRPTFPVVNCPGCALPMEVVVTVTLPNDVLTTTYRCTKCSTETDRTYKRPETK